MVANETVKCVASTNHLTEIEKVSEQGLQFRDSRDLWRDVLFALRLPFAGFFQVRHDLKAPRCDLELVGHVLRRFSEQPAVSNPCLSGAPTFANWICHQVRRKTLVRLKVGRSRMGAPVPRRSQHGGGENKKHGLSGSLTHLMMPRGTEQRSKTGPQSCTVSYSTCVNQQRIQTTWTSFC